MNTLSFFFQKIIRFVIILIFNLFFFFNGISQNISQNSLIGSAQFSISSGVKTKDGGHAFTGNINLPYNQILVLKTDSSGDTLWARAFTFRAYNWPSKIIESPDSGFYICATISGSGTNDNKDILLFKLNKDGDIVIQKSFNLVEDDYALDLILTSDSGIAVVGKSKSWIAGDMDISLLKVNLNEDFLWAKIYGGIFEDYGSGIKPIEGGDLLIVGSTSSIDTPWSMNNYLIKTDSVGSVKWARIYGTNGDDEASICVQDDEGNIYLSGYSTGYDMNNHSILLSKTDSSGHLFWSNFYDYIGFENLKDLKLSGDKLLFGETLWQSISVNTAKSALISLDTTGSLISNETIIPGFTSSYFNSVDINADNSLDLSISVSDTSLNSRMLLLKSDTIYNFPCFMDTFNINVYPASLLERNFITYDSSVIFIDSNEAATIQFASFISEDPCLGLDVKEKSEPVLVIFPNPIESQFCILGIEGMAVIYVYNVTGELISERIGFEKDIIDLKVLPSGIYYLKVKDDSGYRHSKIIKL